MPTAAWIVVLSAAASVSLSLGARQTFGLFLLPLGVEHGISATVLGASVAIHNLIWGLSQPFAGALADRIGTGRVALTGAGIYAVGLLLPAIYPSATTLIIGIGILTGLGTAAAGAGTVLGAVARAVPEHRRGDALGLASAGGSVGQAAMGFIWLGTIPLTSTAIARRFGVADLGALYGVCFLSHQIGGFLGAGAGALVVDATGSYAAFWPVMLAVGLMAIASNWATRAPRLAPA